MQVFLGFAKFYRQFIQGFSQIAISLSSMLKILGSIKSVTQLKKGVIGVDGESRIGYDGNKLDGSEIDDGKIGGGEVNNNVGKKGQKTSKFKNLSKSKKAIGFLDFLTPRAKLAFTILRQAFFKALIFYYFNSEYHIWIEMDI